MFAAYVWDNPPRLTLILGDRGAGKSNLALVLGETLLDDYAVEPRVDHVYIVLPAVRDLEQLDEHRSVTSFDWLKENIQKLRRAYLLLDEGLIALNARAWRQKINTLLIKVSAVARHRELYMSITSQAHRIDVQLRELADAIVVKRTSLARTLVLDKVPKWLIKVDKALRKSEQKSLEELDEREAAWIGVPRTDFIWGIPQAKLSKVLDKWAKDADIKL